MRPRPHTAVQSSSIHHCLKVFSYWMLRKPTHYWPCFCPEGSCVFQACFFLSVLYGTFHFSKQCVWTRMYYWLFGQKLFLFLFNKENLQ